ncbi:MAG TPA: hypothetical protein VJW75_10755 [Candidatus Eisenbacteria bacterium]|nr:hypothetical protein [Candidatus Eisenbacteria bacterium]
MKVSQTGIAVALLTVLAVAGAAVAQQADTTKAQAPKAAMPATPVKAAAPATAAKAEVAATPAKASTAGAKTSSAKSVIGEVVDPACWIVNGSKGDAHKECALACAKAGQVLGILERKTNKLFLLATERPGEDPNKNVIDFCGQTVMAKGRIFTRGGVTAIQIVSVEPYSARATP